LDAFTLSLAKELGPRGVTVNSVPPGVIPTGTTRTCRTTRRRRRRPAARIALGRLGQPEDVADIVAFLASADARWVTGQVIDASGGTAL
jgi:3-oxoacyl-[acyl-carrier protein] reductase